MSGIVAHSGNGAMPSSAELDTAVRIAQNLAASGMFKDARQAEQAFAKILLGRDLGLSPTQAMTSIHVVEGKPELSANLQAQLVKSYRGPDGERYDYEVLEHTDQVCAIEFRRREPGGQWETLGTERFTIEEATRAGLTNPTRNGQPSMYAKYPRNMLWARCISNGVNFHCPEVARGLRVYHEGEIGGGTVPEPVAAVPAGVNPDTGEVLDAVELIDDDQAAVVLDAVRTLADAGVKCGTALQAHGATVDKDSIENTVGSVPADRVDELLKWLRSKLDALPPAAGVPEVVA